MKKPKSWFVSLWFTLLVGSLCFAGKPPLMTIFFHLCFSVAIPTHGYYNICRGCGSWGGDKFVATHSRPHGREFIFLLWFPTALCESIIVLSIICFVAQLFANASVSPTWQWGQKQTNPPNNLVFLPVTLCFAAPQSQNTLICGEEGRNKYSWESWVDRLISCGYGSCGFKTP